MGKCIQHVACPECRKLGKDKKGNNLAIYEDSSTYCFSCGYSTRGIRTNNSDIRTIRQTSTSDKTSRLSLPSGLYYPNDLSTRWLSRYHITTYHIKEYNIQWTEKEKALVFPVYNNKDLIFYQLRCFEKGKPKWRSYGAKPLIFLGNAAPVVLVEDYISAIRVGEVATAVPLFGSTIPTKNLLTIREQYDNIIIWLDYDKAQDKKTKEIIASCKAIFKETHQIITEKDPKAYISEEIKYQIASI